MSRRIKNNTESSSGTTTTTTTSNDNENEEHSYDGQMISIPPTSAALPRSFGNDSNNNNNNNSSILQGKEGRKKDVETNPFGFAQQSKSNVAFDEKRSEKEKKEVRRFEFLDRLEHFTWAWYCLPMSTGGLALLLSPATQPHTFHGLETIGRIVYIFDLTVFTLVTVAMTYRFVRWPTHLKASIAHPTEGLFVNTALLSVASIIACMARYGFGVAGSWLVTTYRVLFWIYFAVTFSSAVLHYFLLFTNPLLKIEDMTPAWDLPIFPFMLCGTIAAVGAEYQRPATTYAVPMIVAGLTAQGLGMLVSILMYASYVRRMIQFGFPSPNSRPAMFIAVGPPSFTSLALIGMANAFPQSGAAVESYFFLGASSSSSSSPSVGITTDTTLANEVTIQILRTMATITAVFIWSLSLWFFSLSVLACIAVRQQMSFHLNWWAFVFPNVGFTVATISIGKAFRSQGVLWVGSVMTLLLVAVYLWVGCMHVRAVYKKEILWDGRDEDVYVREMHGKKTGPIAEKYARALERKKDAANATGVDNGGNSVAASVNNTMRTTDVERGQ